MCGHMVMSDHRLAEQRCGVYTWWECRCIKAVCTWHRQKHWLSSVCIFCWTARGRAVNHAASRSSRLMKGDKLQTFPPSLQPSSLLLLLCCCIASGPHSYHLSSPLLVQCSRHLAIEIIYFLSWHLSFFDLCVLSSFLVLPPFLLHPLQLLSLCTLPLKSLELILGHGLYSYEWVKSYQVVIRPDAKQFSEVAEGHRSICFKAEVWEVVGRSEVAAFTKREKNIREHETRRRLPNIFNR